MCLEGGREGLFNTDEGLLLQALSVLGGEQVLLRFFYRFVCYLSIFSYKDGQRLR